jgi:hypothetical protein
MLKNNAATLALGVLLLSSFGFGCGGSGVSLGNDGQGGRSGADPGAGGVVAGAGAPGGAGSPSAAGGTSAGGATSSAGSPSAGGDSGGTTSAGAPSTGGVANNGGAGGAGNAACQDPVALGGGWERCKNGLLHRPTPGKCEYTPRAAAIPATGAADQCTKDSQCTAKPNGYCAFVSAGNTARQSANFCLYGCLSDSDCDPGNVCQCGDGAGAGVCSFNTPSCKSDADCAGALCTNYDAAPGCMSETFACQTPADKCEADSDCPASGNGAICTLSGTHRACSPITCAF